MKPRSQLGLLVLVTLVTLSTACNQRDASAPEQVEAVQREADLAEDMSGAKVPAGAAVVSKLELSNGNVLHFINEGADDYSQVGVVELSQPGNGAVLPTLLRGERPTALELYQALSAEPAPAALVFNHLESARADDIPLTPRKLDAGLAPQETNVSYCFDLPYDLHYAAQSTASSAFGSVPPNHAHVHGALYTHYLTTGVSAQRVLATCNAAGYVKSVSLYYRTSLFNAAPSAPISPVNPWHKLDLGFEWLFPGQSVIYYSSHSPLAYSLLHPRYRIRVGFTWEGSSFNRAHTEGFW